VGKSRLPSNLIGGAVLLAVLGLLALAAPVLATGLPWLVRSDDGLHCPAFRAYLGLSARPPAAGVALLRAPIPHGPSELALDNVLASPSSGHWMGTDALGRDIAARVLHGGRVSLGVGILAAVFALLIGVPLGALAGYLRGWTDAAISRLIETILCFPTLLLVLALLAAAPAWLRGLADVPRIALVLGLSGWIPVARYLRGEFMKLRDSPMAQAARALGGSHLRVMARHILPSALAPVLVTAAFAVAAAIVVEASLSFLGLGIRPPVATWGGLLADAREQVDRAWWLAVFPGVALFLAVLGCSLLGEGVRDYLDPRSSRP
jgi:peptide/nickel transport system permease protein